MSIKAIVAASVLAAVTLGAPARADDAPAYRITKSVALGAPDRWDCVVFDPASHRVYIAHGDRVSVVDGRDGGHSVARGRADRGRAEPGLRLRRCPRAAHALAARLAY